MKRLPTIVCTMAIFKLNIMTSSSESFLVTSLLLLLFFQGVSTLQCKVNVERTTGLVPLLCSADVRKADNACPIWEFQDSKNEMLSTTVPPSGDCDVIFRQNCTHDALIRDFPRLFNVSEFPAPPDNMKLLPFDRYDNHYAKYYPGADVVLWPTIFGAMEQIRGFFVNMTYLNDINNCLLMRLEDGHEITHKHREAGLNFSVNLWPLYWRKAVRYVFKAYSLPMPSNDAYPDKLHTVAYMMTATPWTKYMKGNAITVLVVSELGCLMHDTFYKGSKLLHNASKPDFEMSHACIVQQYSGKDLLNWSPVISYTNVSSYDQGTLKVMKVKGSFSAAPANFKILKYIITLYRVTSGTDIQDEHCDEADSIAIAETEFEFVGIYTSGFYRIQVKPDQCPVCIRTWTERFLLLKEGEKIPTVPERPVTTTTVTTTKSVKSSIGTTMSSSVTSEEVSSESLSQKYQIIIGVICSLLVIFVIVIGYVLLRKCYQDGNEGENQNNACKKKPRVALVAAIKGVPRTVRTPPLNNESNVGSAPKRKCLYLVHADDNKFHNQVINMFATYLYKHCMCDVLYHPWCNTDKYRWMVNALERADFTILITSKSAFDQYQIWKHPNNKEMSTQSGPKDLFLPAFRLLCKRLTDHPNFSEKLLTVYFDYSSDQDIPPDICSSGHFKLLQCFDNFILQIHGKNSFIDANIGHYVKSDLSKTPEGKALLEAVKKAKKKVVGDYIRSDSGFDSIGANKSLPEDDLKYVRQNYLQCDSSSAVPAGSCVHSSTNGDIQWGVFKIDPDECSLLDRCDPSICPAETIYEGNIDHNYHSAEQPGNQKCIQKLPTCHQTTELTQALPNKRCYVQPVMALQRLFTPRLCEECIPVCCSADFLYETCPAPCPSCVSKNVHVPILPESYNIAQEVGDSVSQGFTGFEGFSGPDDPDFIAPELSDCGDISSQILAQQMEDMNQRYLQHIADNLPHSSEKVHNYSVNISVASDPEVSENTYKYQCPSCTGVNHVGLNIECGLPDPGPDIDFYPPDTDDSSIENNAEVASIGGVSF